MGSSGAVVTGGLGFLHPVASGRWGGMPVGPGTSAIANQTLNLAPIRFVKSGAIDRIAVEVTVAGDVASTVTPAWYSDNAGLPGSPLLAIGSAPGDAIAVTQLVVSLPITGGQTYWIGGVTQGAPTIQPTLRSLTNSVVSVGLAAAVTLISNTCNGVRQNGVAGALPDPFVFADFAFQIPRLAWRFV